MMWLKYRYTHRAARTVGLALILGCIAAVWLAAWLVRSNVIPPRRSTDSAVSSSDGSTAEHGQGATIGERVLASTSSSETASSVAGHVKSKEGLIPLKIHCVSKRPQAEPIPGIKLRVITPDGVLAAADLESDSDGAATALVPPGSYFVVGRDPESRMAMIPSADGPCVVSAPGAAVTLIAAPIYLASVRLCGDEVIALRSGRHPAGYRMMGPATEAPGGELLYSYCPLSPKAMPPAQLLEIVAFGRLRGECRFHVPLTRADMSREPTVCDLSLFPARPATRLAIQVRDSASKVIPLDWIELDCHEGPFVRADADGECWVPFGFEYQVTLGRFPIRWATPSFSRFDTRHADGSPKRIALNLPVELVKTHVLIQSRGQTVAPRSKIQVKVIGEWRLPGCDVVGKGSQRQFDSGDIGHVWLPLGSMTWRIAYESTTYDVNVSVNGESSMCVDLNP